MFFSSGVAFAQTQSSASVDLKALVEQLQAQIKALQTQVESLKAELNTSKKEIETSKQEINISKKDIESIKEDIHFSKILKRGETGDEVRKLQEYLSQFPDIYPDALVTGYFGAKTEIAVRKLQERHGLDSVGVVGPRTVAKLNELLTEGAGQSGVVPPGLLTAPGIEKRVTNEDAKEPVLLVPAPVVSIVSSTTSLPQTIVSVTTTISQTSIVSPTSLTTYPKTSNECSAKYGSGWHIMDSSGRCFDLSMQNYRDVDSILYSCSANYISGCMNTASSTATNTTATTGSSQTSVDVVTTVSVTATTTITATTTTTATTTATTTVYSIATTTAPSTNNSVLTVTRLFPGQYDNTKYSLALSDTEGLGDIHVNKAGGGFIWSGSPRNGNPPCPKGPISTGTVTLNPSDFPLSGYVIDCATAGVQYPVSAAMPPLAFGASDQNFASLLEALAYTLQNLQQLLK